MQLTLIQKIQGYKISNGRLLAPVNNSRLAQLQDHALAKLPKDASVPDRIKGYQKAKVAHWSERKKAMPDHPSNLEDKPVPKIPDSTLQPSPPVSATVASTAKPDSPTDTINQGAVTNSDKLKSEILIELPTEKISNSAGVISNKFVTSPDGFIHLASLGMHPHNTGILQQIDKDAVDKMVSNFNEQKKDPKFAGLLIDRDHLSQQNNTSAAGWITKLEGREDGLWGKPEWTPDGEKDIVNGTYRMTSPVWTKNNCQDVNSDGKILKPLVLHSLALTNEPNLKNLTPITSIV